jgi:HlyD family secretion protein
MKKKWKIIFGIAVIVILLGTVIFQSSKALEVSVKEVKPQTIAKIFEEEGKVISETERPIYSQYPGKIIDVLVEEGQEIKKGDLLLVLNSDDLIFQLEQLKAQLKSVRGEEKKLFQEPYESKIKSQELRVEQARRDFNKAKIDFERIDKLYNEDAVTKSEYEDYKNLYESALNNLRQQEEELSLIEQSYSSEGGTKQYYTGIKESLEAQIDLLEYKINNYKIVSPVQGIIANLNVKTGEVISSSIPLMTVFKDESYDVESFVLTEDVGSIKNKMKVTLIQDRKDKDIVFEGTVKNIAPSAVEKISSLGLEEQRVKVTIKPEIPDNLDLHPGYELDVIFTTDKKKNKLVVPKTALFPYEDSDAVWVAEKGKAEVRQVKKGFENDLNVVIEEGLENGDLVILNPQLEGLKEGKKINKFLQE